MAAPAKPGNLSIGLGIKRHSCSIIPKNGKRDVLYWHTHSNGVSFKGKLITVNPLKMGEIFSRRLELIGQLNDQTDYPLFL